MGKEVVNYGSAVNDATGDALHIAYAKIDAGSRLFGVIDKDLTAPPGSPAIGDCYIVGASATGAWATHDGKIAVYGLASTWLFIAPNEGIFAYVRDEDTLYRHDGSAWGPYPGALPAAVDTDLWTGTSTSKAVTPDALLDSAKFQTLTDGATITPNFGAGFNFKVTLGGNRTLANPSNAKDGQSGVIRVIQDATGGRTLSYGSNWRFPGGAASGGLLSTAANAIDMIAFIVGEGGLIYATLNKAFAA